ncbi:four helix bundle protein [Candidatus Microgenomates bacterium]|nr:MAG: four helix bundle protein [Candidatus Microgenomates bacterium]
MKITGLNDIAIYKTALLLTQKVYQVTKHENLRKEYALVDQIRRAAISVAANIAEGYGRNTRRDFAQFLSISLGSVNEVITYLDFITLEFHIETTALKSEYLILSKQIYTFRSYLLRTLDFKKTK